MALNQDRNQGGPEGGGSGEGNLNVGTNKQNSKTSNTIGLQCGLNRKRFGLMRWREEGVGRRGGPEVVG